MTGISRTVLGCVIAVLIFAAGAVVGWFGGSAHPALADVPTIAIYDGWRLACPAASQKDGRCAISNDLIETKTGRKVAQLAIVPAKTGSVLIVTAPFDVLLTAGMGLALDGSKPQPHPFLTCNNAGCVAEIPFDDALRDQMRHAKQGKLLFANLERKTVAVMFSLDGFTRADDAIKARQGGHTFFGMAI